MPSDSTTLLAQEWLRLDQDPQTRDEINCLLIQNAHDELSSRLSTRIAFGTAGLRAKMEAGFARMNPLTVIQASQGLADYLMQMEKNVKHRGIVIGRDGRRGSENFAKLAASAFTSRGIRVFWYERMVHTPLVPFSVRFLQAAAGIMITASHNPAADNGYKVYWSDGCQINTPHDSGIASAIEKNLEPKQWDTSCVARGDALVESALGHVEDAYFRAVETAAKETSSSFEQMEDAHLAQLGSSIRPRFVYTPLHGVGLPFMTRAVQDLGLDYDMVVVPSQAEPNPDFPTVRFPNPEEKGALDEAKATADAHGIHLIVASDPDADRLAVAEKVGDEWHQLTGNQLGVLLAAHVLETYPPSKRHNLAMLASTVSSRMLSSMAEIEGFHYTETLTGFRWLGTAALDLERAGLDVRFAFEEAIGYMISSVVHDKDSISAAAVFLTALERWKKLHGVSPWQKLQKLYNKYGYFEEANTYLRSPSAAKTEAVFAAIRNLSEPYPQTLGGKRILRWRDLTQGYDSATKDHVPDLPTSKSTQMITCEVEGNVRFTIRGSGTEPKIKLYVECSAGSSSKAKEGAQTMQQIIIAEWFKPEQNGLELAT